MDDITAVVNESSHVTVAQLCSHENGTVIVPTSDWTKYLGTYFRKVVGIKKYHHLHLSEDSPVVDMKVYSDSPPMRQNLLQMTPPAGTFPELLVPQVGVLMPSASGICTR